MGEYIKHFLKGVAMGAANVIPGVSGGTVALVVGIYRRLIEAIRSINAPAIRLLFTGQLKEFIRHTDGAFLFTLGVGVCVGILSVAQVLKYCLENYPAWTYSLFFGLILASVHYVAKEIKAYTAAAIASFVTGILIAVFIAFITPASENRDIYYLVLCGAISICSMILPGLSGSFVLILMGNYVLVLSSITAFTAAAKAMLLGETDKVTAFFKGDSFMVLLCVGVGMLVGILLFARLLSWVYKRYENATLALLTGFVAGSLLIIWPWKVSNTEEIVIADGKTKEVVTGYDWYLPDFATLETWGMIAVMLGGVLALLVMAKKKRRLLDTGC